MTEFDALEGAREMRLICPYCNVEFNWLADVGAGRRPREGDAVGCVLCGEVGMLTGATELRRMTESDRERVGPRVLRQIALFAAQVKATKQRRAARLN